MLPKRMSIKTWNDVWFPKVKPIPATTKGYLMVGQLMDGEVEFEGKIYRVVAWANDWEGKPYVVARIVEPHA